MESFVDHSTREHMITIINCSYCAATQCTKLCSLKWCLSLE